ALPATPRRRRRSWRSRTDPVRPPCADSSNVRRRMRWAISGGAGFLGLHLARRLVADGHDVRTLDLAPLDDAGLERSVEELRGDVRAGRRGLAVVILGPKTFIGPERLGVFEILFDWIREGRRIPILGDGSNRYQLLAVEDLVEATVSAGTADVAGETFNVGAT